MQNRQTVSIVMTTYNGTRFVIQQLDSIRTQTRPADEVLILDDRSTDDTISLLKEYKEQYQLDTWKIIENDQNMGWKRNFIKGFEMAAGDIIFCADQDDIWYPEKLKIMTGIMEEHPEINVLASNLEPFYEGEQADKLAEFYIRDYGQDYLSRVKFDKMWMEVQRPGCALCFRKSFLPLMYIVWEENCAHDAALWETGVASQSLFIVNEPLIHYRRHSETHSPSNAKNFDVRRHIVLITVERIRKMIKNNGQLNLSGDNLTFANQMLKFYERRLRIMDKRKILPFAMLLPSVTMYPSVLSYFADIYSAIKY